MTRIQLRRGNAAAWTAANPVLAQAEVGVEVDTLKWKIGDGSTVWNSLPYTKSTWSSIEGKPAVVAAGATQAEARTAIGATNLALGTTSTTAKAGDYTPSSGEITSALGYTPENPAARGQANGYASLDGAGKVPVSQLPSSIMEYQGTYNASTNSPSLADGTGNAGDVYRVAVAGTRNFGSGAVQLRVGDYVIYSGSVWQKSATTDVVASVATLTGDISSSALKTAISLDAVDNTSDSAKPVSTATQTALNDKQQVLTATTVKTTAYTAAANELIPVDASGGPVTITLPQAPASGTRFVVKKIDTSANTVTLSCQGSDRFNTSGGSSTRTLTLPNEAAQLQYNSSLSVWYVISTDLPLSQTDLRYLGITSTATAAQRLSTPRLISGVSFDGTADINPVTAATVGLAWFPAGYVADNYYYTNSAQATATSNGLGVGIVRVSPWIVTQAVTVTRLFAEFSVAGDANSVYRIGVWNHDTATCKPSTLVLDAGTISTGSGNAGTVATGGTPGVYEISINSGEGISLAPGIYWVGGAVQGVTTTQPTMRVGQNFSYPLTVPLGTSLPSANATIFGWLLTGQTGAFGSLASAVRAASTVNAARIGFRVA